MPEFKTLYKRYRDQDAAEIFALFRWNSANGENWETPFARLASLAKHEDWDFKSAQFRKPGQEYPILMNYLNYTFLRLQTLGLINFSPDGQKAIFNTGLQSKSEKDIYATFFLNKEWEARNLPKWTLFTFADSYSEKLAPFHPLPGVASYIQDAKDLVFDFNYEVDVNIEHIVEHNQERLPESIRGNRTLALSAIEGSTKFLKQKVLRNYKVAIPHWYDGRIQLLLPLNLTSDTEADLALVADRDDNRQIYRIRTALTMDMAYVNARLICRPDREWLNP